MHGVVSNAKFYVPYFTVVDISVPYFTVVDISAPYFTVVHISAPYLQYSGFKNFIFRLLLLNDTQNIFTTQLQGHLKKETVLHRTKKIKEMKHLIVEIIMKLWYIIIEV